jgi:hypothetical protein
LSYHPRRIVFLLVAALVPQYCGAALIYPVNRTTPLCSLNEVNRARCVLHIETLDECERAAADMGLRSTSAIVRDLYTSIPFCWYDTSNGNIDGTLYFNRAGFRATIWCSAWGSCLCKHASPPAPPAPPDNPPPPPAPQFPPATPEWSVTPDGERRIPPSHALPGSRPTVEPAGCADARHRVGCVAPPRVIVPRPAPVNNTGAFGAARCGMPHAAAGCVRHAVATRRPNPAGTAEVPNHVRFRVAAGAIGDASSQYSERRHDQDMALGDYDNDGDLDLLIVQWDRPDEFHVNSGGGYFTNHPCSISTAEGSHGPASFRTVSGVFGDLDGDGYLDVLLGRTHCPFRDCTNELHQNVPNPTSQLVQRTFAKVNAYSPGRSPLELVEMPTTTVVVALADFNNDARLDVLYIGVLPNGNPQQLNSPHGLYRNENSGGSITSWGLVTNHGLVASTGDTTSAVWGDYDGGEPSLRPRTL